MAEDRADSVRRAGRGPGRAVRADETPELRRLRRRIDALDRRIVGLLNERTALGIATGAAKAATGRRVIRDQEREREVLMRVALANSGPLPQAELLALYRRLIAATRDLEVRQGRRSGAERGDGQPEPGVDE